LITKYHLDGIRINKVPELPKAFWTQLHWATGVYKIGEVFDGDVGGWLFKFVKFLVLLTNKVSGTVTKLISYYAFSTG
jgi:hypothetical protein